MKTSELQGAALDWAVAKCEGVTVLPKMRGGHFVTMVRGETWLLQYSSNWYQGGPIVEREKIDLMFEGPEWYAYMRFAYNGVTAIHQYDGPTPLIAAMRCYVASKLGDEVEIPEGLLEVSNG